MHAYMHAHVHVHVHTHARIHTYTYARLHLNAHVCELVHTHADVIPCMLFQVFRKMVDVVNHCHELGVMHRDLKPENFLLTSKVRIVPFLDSFLLGALCF